MNPWFGSDTTWTILSNTASVAGGGVLAYVGLVRFSRQFRLRCLTLPLRGRRNLCDEKTMREAMIAEIESCLEGGPLLPAHSCAEALRSRKADPTSPWDDVVGELRAWVQSADRPGAPSLAARLVAPDQAVLAERFLHGVRQYLARFEHLTVVGRSVADRVPSEVSSRIFASCLSGAAVLADAGASRGGILDGLVVWHDTTYRDEDTSWSEGQAFNADGEALPVDDDFKLGDYNGRLLELLAVSVTANAHDGSTAFVLETRETCYRATEPPSPLASKQLVRAADDPLTPAFTAVDDRARVARDSREVGPGRVLPLTAYVSLTCRIPGDHRALLRVGQAPGGPDEVEALMLCRRSGRTRNGAGTLSAAAGGVMELDQPGASLDTDVLGAPDVEGAVRRETCEELGLEAPDFTMYPAAVWVATVLGRGATLERPKGQAVASALYIGHSFLDFDQVARKTAGANRARGAFEVDDLVAIAMPSSHGGVNEFAEIVAAFANQMDQHGLLSAFYAAAGRYGTEDAVAAFTRAFGSEPWWVRPWSGEVEAPRICRDPGAILPGDREAIVSAVPAWAGHWLTTGR